MRHYGPEPPWRGRSFHYGSWRRVDPSPDSWFDEPGHWEWIAPPATALGFVSGILADYYLPSLQRELNRELSYITEWRIEQGTKLPRSHAAVLSNLTEAT